MSGTISEEERRRVENNLGRHPELRRELRRIENNSQTRTLAKPAETGASNPQIALTTSKSLSHEPVARVGNLNPENSILFWRITAAAAVCLALLACYFAVDFRTKFDASQGTLQAERERNVALSNDLLTTQQKLDRMSGTIESLNDPTYSKVLLAGTTNATDIRAVVFWDPRSTRVFVTSVNLPPLPSTSQYQLWALSDDGPIDAGVFETTGEIIRMKDVPGASAFCITVGPPGGNPRFDVSTQLLRGETGM
jgi:anti-sigma-K factor RskA